MKKSKWNNFKKYYTLDTYYKNTFHRKVAKISLNAGFTCPNIDGTVGYGGCIYCSPLGSGDFAGKATEDIVTQFHNIKKEINKKWKNPLYIGYFQAHTNTYAPLPVLKEKYEAILKEKNVIGLSIATRPDAISKEVMDYLEELSTRTYLQIELGLQTIHNKTSIFINRCHTLDCFKTCVEELRKRNINVVVHIINGLPYETKEMMLDTIKYVNELDIQGIKIHMLHIIKNTSLARIYEKQKFKILTKEEYIDIVCTELEYLRPDIVIHRITGDPDINNLIEPKWLKKKLCILNDIDKELVRRKTYQGFRLNKENLLKQIIEPILHDKDYIIDYTNHYEKLLSSYIKKENILKEIELSMIGKITAILTNEIEKEKIQTYLTYLHHRGFILIITKTKPNQELYKEFHTTYYEFSEEMYCIKIDTNALK